MLMGRFAATFLVLSLPLFGACLDYPAKVPGGFDAGAPSGDPCADLLELHMDRVRSDFAALVKPDYDDPLDPLVSDVVGFFEKGPLQAATPMTVDHANMLTEELRNLVIALGGVPSTTDDTQLATLCEQGTFTPEVVGITPIAYNTQEGSYYRLGRWVTTTVVMNVSADAGDAGVSVRVKLPYQMDPVLAGSHVFPYLLTEPEWYGGSGLITRAYVADFAGTTVALLEEVDVPTPVNYGILAAKTIKMTLTYPTDGTYNY